MQRRAADPELRRWHAETLGVACCLWRLPEEGHKVHGTISSSAILMFRNLEERAMAFWSEWSDGKRWLMGIVGGLIVAGTVAAVNRGMTQTPPTSPANP